MTINYDLKESIKRIGRLYPVLKAADGEILDGLHRKEVDPKWEEKVLLLSDPVSKLLVRIAANMQRRTVSKKERREQFNRLAELLLEKGMKRGEIAEEISKLGFSVQYVRSLLEERYKDPSKQRSLRNSVSQKKLGKLKLLPFTTEAICPNCKESLVIEVVPKEKKVKLKVYEYPGPSAEYF